MKNNLISPIDKILLFQYNKKTYYEKCIYWVNYYMQWGWNWICFYFQKWVYHMREYVQKTGGIFKWLEKGGAGGCEIRKRPKAANEIMEFIEVQYDNWEKRVSMGGGEDGRRGNENMKDKYYDKDAFKQIYKEMVIGSVGSENEEEKLWKGRVMIVYVPMIGNVMMYYDIFRMSFGYYSDTQGVNYNILNACAMRYVLLFQCMDLFMDELIGLRYLNEHVGLGGSAGEIKYWKSPLRWINKVIEDFELKKEMEEEEGGENGCGHRGIYGGVEKGVRKGEEGKGEGKGIKLGKEEKDKLFAKLKQYRTEYVPENEIKLRNKFVYKGKTTDAYHHVFCKKVMEVKVMPMNDVMDIKKSFYSGLLPIKLPKIYETENNDFVMEKYKIRGAEDIGEGGFEWMDDEECSDENGEECEVEEKELSSYAKWKREIGK